MSNNGIVNIHGKDYMTVARRVELAHQEKALVSVQTEVLIHSPIVVKATVNVGGSIFTGISSVDIDSAKMIEKSNPYEVAETSAVGRALGFAGYGIVEGIASADEMLKPHAEEAQAPNETVTREPVVSDDLRTCSAHEQPEVMTKGHSTSKNKDYWFHDKNGQRCFGYGYQ